MYYNNKKNDSKIHVGIQYFPLISLPLVLPFLINEFVIPRGIEWLLILGIGCFTQIGQIWITEGLRIIPAAKACSINYSQVIFASIWGIIIFNERLDLMVALGAVSVLISSMITISAIEKTH